MHLDAAADDEDQSVKNIAMKQKCRDDVKFHIFWWSTEAVKQKTDKHTLHSKSFFVPKTSSQRTLQKRNLSSEVVHHRLFVDILTSENFYWLKHRMESLVALSTRSRGFSWCCHSWIISLVILLCFASSYLKLEDFFLRLFRLLNGSCSQSASNIWKFIEKTLEKLWCLFNHPWEILSRNANDVFRMLFQVYIFHVSLTAVTSSLKRSFCTEPGITAELFPLF